LQNLEDLSEHEMVLLEKYTRKRFKVNTKSYRWLSFSSLSSMRMFEADKCNGMDISFTGSLEYAEWKVFSD
jgi:hypothetical protein